MDKKMVGEVLAQTKIAWAIPAVILFTFSQAAMAKRWTTLLKAHDIFISFSQAVRLTFLGLFYNNFMPGSVGGDLLKGWYATHHCDSDKKLHAALSVLFDRILGLSGTLILGSLAAFSLASSFSLPVNGYSIDIRMLIIGIIVLISVGAVFVLSRRVRKYLFITNLLERLPAQEKLKKIEQGIHIYRQNPGALLLALLITFAVQTMAITSIWLLTISLGLKGITLLHCITIMPIVWVISAAIPVPGGLGIIENLMIPFFIAAADHNAFNSPEELTARVMALTLLNRLMIYISSAPGGLVPIFGGHLPPKSEIEADFSDNGN
ncbi:MAG: flippase-like domain-containing protein [Sedimentisphaerales bacterium]|nr:flippase-like domain-containing protein [Sedimentisphaerales bacterium]MBN2842957.1 flippase-like domain-containing protein [Sedimentisphaerales bacterium]